MQRHASIVIACRFFAVVIMFNLAALAELPQSLDDVLFSMTGGTNYVAWMAAEGEIAFRKPFSLFGSAII